MHADQFFLPSTRMIWYPCLQKRNKRSVVSAQKQNCQKLNLNFDSTACNFSQVSRNFNFASAAADFSQVSRKISMHSSNSLTQNFHHCALRRKKNQRINSSPCKHHHTVLNTSLSVKTCPNFCSIYRQPLSGTRTQWSSSRIIQNGRNLLLWFSVPITRATTLVPRHLKTRKNWGPYPSPIHKSCKGGRLQKQCLCSKNNPSFKPYWERK
jgi:hypothetical protein